MWIAEETLRQRHSMEDASNHEIVLEVSNYTQVSQGIYNKGWEVTKTETIPISVILTTKVKLENKPFGNNQS